MQRGPPFSVDGNPDAWRSVISAPGVPCTDQDTVGMSERRLQMSPSLTGHNRGIRLLLLLALVIGTPGLNGTARAEQDSAARDSDTRPPNIVLMVSDDQRPDTIHALGNHEIRTPHLDALVHRGTAFTRAVCCNPICTPARAELLTGASGFRNGVRDFGGSIDDSLPRIAGVLSEAGYATYYVGKWHNNGRPVDHGYRAVAALFGSGGGRFARDQRDYAGRPVTGYRGWVFQSADRTLYPEYGVGLFPEISTRFADAATGVISSSQSRPYFLHVNFTAPHDPLLLPTDVQFHYSPENISLPPNFAEEHPFDHGNFDGRDERLFAWPRTARETRRELAAYYAVLTHLDAQVGRILRAIDSSPTANNTLIIYTSDHGLAMGSHGLRGKQNMYEHTIGIPLVIAGPGVSSNLKSPAQCCLRDLVATICESAGQNVSQFPDSESLWPVLRGETQTLRRYVFGYFRDFQRMIRSAESKLIYYPQIDRWQFFDLVNDPHELHDRHQDAAFGETVTLLRGELLQWQKSVGDAVEAK